jgi:hypothetical protein
MAVSLEQRQTAQHLSFGEPWGVISQDSVCLPEELFSPAEAERAAGLFPESDIRVITTAEMRGAALSDPNND